MEEKEVIESVLIRKLKLEDYQELKETMIAAYSSWNDAYWKESHIAKLLDIFPEGQFGVEVNGKIVGCALSIIVNYDRFDDKHTYKDITGEYTFDTHTSKGDVLYGVDVFIKPDFRGLRLGRRLYDARKELCENLNLKAIVFGGRLPNYHKYADTLKPKDYINKVKLREINDPTLNFQLSNEFHVQKVLTGYLPGDEESKDYAALLRWDNIYYQKVDDDSPNKSVVRLSLIQWQMRNLKDINAFYQQAEFFIKAVSAYNSDFVLFPEFFNAPLVAEFNDLAEPNAFRKLAEYTEDIRKKFIDYAVTYNVNIITGSMPEFVDGKLYNVGFLCKRNGTYEKYEKLHVTPDEVKAWGMQGGNTIKVYETDCCKIGVLICYDVEFPELSRLQAMAGMDILFVPFLTDTQNGYMRVRNCAQARAIENECYVAIAGSVGNLPKINNMDIQYAQSAVFTPSDFSFPTNTIKSEATPNTEMMLVVDVDLDLLKELHTRGSVRNLKDRRTDLYELKLVKE